LFARIYNNFIAKDPVKDRLTYEAVIEPYNDATTIFSICRKKDIKPFKKTYSDVVNYYKLLNNFKAILH